MENDGMPLKVNALDIELECGGVTVKFNLVDDADRQIVERVHGALKRALEDRNEGEEFHGRKQFNYNESWGAIEFEINWDCDSAEQLASTVSMLQHALSGTRGTDSALTDYSTRDEGMNAGQQEPQAESGAPHIPPVDVDRSGWLQILQNEDAHLWGMLAKRGIESDESYIQGENEFPIESRIALARHRFQYGLDKSENTEAPGGQDLRVIALFAPPWLTEVPTEISGFPVRAANVLRRERITTVRQLQMMTPQWMLKLNSFGWKTYEDMVDILRKHLMSYAEALLRPDQSSGTTNGNLKAPNFTSFTSLWEDFVAILDDERKQEVLSRRIGMGGSGFPETLDTIGADYEVCRERIRQIQVDSIKQLHNDVRFRRIKEALERELKNQIDWRQGPIPLGDECPVVVLRDAPAKVVKSFFHLILRSQYKVLLGVNANGDELARIVSGVSEKEHKVAVENLEDFICANSDKRKSEFLPFLDRYIRETFDSSIYSDLKEYVDDWINWDYSADPGIISFGDSIHAAVAAVLVRGDRPLRREEIVDRARKDYGLEQASSSILNAVAELCDSTGKHAKEDVLVTLFQRARGEYCAKRHLDIDLDSAEYLVPELVSLIVDGRESLIEHEPYQWHTVDLWEEIKARFPNNPSAKFDRTAGWRLVDALLRYHAPIGITSLTKGYWISDKAERTSQTKRTKQEVVEYILTNLADQDGLTRRELFELFKQIQSPGVIDPFQGLKSPVVLESGRYRLSG